MKFERIILHIGRHKSGTSAIQHFLNQNDEALKSNGILYPKAGRVRRQVAHHQLATDLNSNDPLPGIDHFCTNLLDEYDPSYHTLLLSSEALQNIKDLSSVEHLLARLPHKSCDVICYIREFLDYMISGFRQRVQNQPSFLTFPQYAGMTKPGQMRVFMTNWEAIGRCHYKWFDRNHLKNQNVIDDFFDMAQLSYPDNHVENFTRNPSLGGNLLYFKMAANARGEPFADYRQQEALVLQEKSFQKSFHISDTTAAQLRTDFGYNDSLLPVLGDVALKSWAHLPKLPDYIAFESDADMVQSAHPELDLSWLMDQKSDKTDWFA